MTEISEENRDAIVELINIAFGRAAASLSELTGQRVILEVPNVVVCPIDEVAGHFGGMMDGDVATVHQIFTGPVAGDALLMLDIDGAVHLSSLLAEARRPADRLDDSDREVLTEVGNILLNACLGTFGNMLDVSITFSVPRLRIDAVHALLRSLVIESTELRHALVVSTDFSIREGSVGGYLVIVLGVASLDRLLAAAESM